MFNFVLADYEINSLHIEQNLCVITQISYHYIIKYMLVLFT